MQSLPRKIRTNKSFKSILGKINFKKKGSISFSIKSFKIQSLFLKNFFKNNIFRKNEVVPSLVISLFYDNDII